MKYVSTRGKARDLTFKEALLTGLASDGGLYVPDIWPRFTPEEIAGFRGRPYAEVALAVMEKFTGGEIARDDLQQMIEDAYAGFTHPAVTPLVQLGPNDWLLELFYGPTLAFKDLAMQILARLIDHVLAERRERLTIVGATSGDTGGAALAAFRESKRVDVFFMYPDGKVSGFQRRQMTTLNAPNCHAIALDGSFDDCQNLVKALFARPDLREGFNLSAVNSINWGRIMAQVVYYFTAATALGAPDRKVSFCVPTGNFGDIYAGYVAHLMGLPIDRLVIANNENDILTRTLSTGDHALRDVVATNTPSMDIQISSNFERLLFEVSGHDATLVARLMADLAAGHAYELPQALRHTIGEIFDAGRATQTEASARILSCYSETGYLCDPHTAVALHVAEQFNDVQTPMITLSTAHPIKFSETVQQATGRVAKLPPGQQDRETLPEQVTKLPNDLETLARFIRRNSSAVPTPA